MLEKLTKATFENAVKEGVCLVAIGAPWCPDCRKIEPIIGMLMQEYGTQVKFLLLWQMKKRHLRIL